MHRLHYLPLVFAAALLASAQPSMAVEPMPPPSLASGLSTNSTPPLSQSIDNPYFRVLKNASAPLEANTNIASRVIVALRNVQIQSPRGDQKLDRGQIAVFNPGETFKITGEYFEVSFKADHPPLKEPSEWIEPSKNTIIHDAPEFRIFEEQLGPGDTRAIHSHAQRVVIRLNEVQLIDPRFHEKAGPGKGGLQVPDTAKYADPIVHVVKNLSQIPLDNIVIEYKIPKHEDPVTSLTSPTATKP